MKITPPEGISDADYETIEAAVMETARGRWFLAEFDRRCRAADTRQMLDAIARLEHVVVEQKTLPADPAIRLLVQRLKDVGRELDATADDLRAQGVDEASCARIEAQARALGGLLRLNGTAAPATAPASFATDRPAAPAAIAASSRHAPAPPPMPGRKELMARQTVNHDSRLAALARLESLPLADKLALFG